MKKIMLISPKDNNFYNFRSELILELLKKYEVVLVCPYGKKIDYFTEIGCRFIDLKIDRRGTSILNDFKLICNYAKILKKEHPDLVLTYTLKCSVYGGMVCGIKKIPYIINMAGLIDTGNSKSRLERFLQFLYKISFRKATCMMYQNRKERDVVNKILNNRVNYRDIPGSGVNISQFSYKEYPSNDDIVTFNYVARIVDIKGINEFLECAIRIKKEYTNTRFVIYGDYDNDSYRPIIAKLQEEGIVEYAGVLLDMKPAIEACHAVIHPSYYEGMTNVVLEHSAMGRPCIGSDVPGVADGIEDGVTGYTFPCKNVDALIDIVKQFIALSNTEKESMGRAAREKMEKEFNRTIVTNTYIEEIEKAI